MGARRATVGEPTDSESINVPVTRPGAAENAHKAERAREGHETFIPEAPQRDDRTDAVRSRAVEEESLQDGESRHEKRHEPDGERRHGDRHSDRRSDRTAPRTAPRTALRTRKTYDRTSGRRAGRSVRPCTPWPTRRT